MAKHEVPSLASLHHAPEEAYKNDALQLLLSYPPNSKWVKKHPMVTVKDETGRKVPLEYLPIDKVKVLLTRIFQVWNHEITGCYQMFNSVVVTVKLNYKNPVTGEWEFKCGIGAVGVQTDKDAKASDMSSIKLDAVMKAAPAAESYAIKNAAEKIGPIFGGNLGHYDVAGYQGLYSKKPESSAPEAPKQTEAPSEYTEAEEFGPELPI